LVTRNAEINQWTGKNTTVIRSAYIFNGNKWDFNMAITESRIRRIIREEARRALREGSDSERNGGLSFGQPEIETYQESLEITFPYTLGGETGSAELSYGNLEDALGGGAEAVIERFAEDNRHLAFQADDDFEDEEAAPKFVADALMGSPDFNMERFRSDLKEVKPNRFNDGGDFWMKK